MRRAARGAVVAAVLLAAAGARADEPAALVFRWRALPGAIQYDLEIAADPAFANVVLRETVATNVFRWTTMTRQTYYWRVRGVDADGRKGNFSRPRPIRAVVGTPRLIAPQNSGWGIRAKASNFANLDYLDVFGNTSGTCSACGSVGTHSQQVAPGYIDAASFDLRIFMTSPLCDAGAADLGIDVNGPAAGNYDGTAPDIGAWEAR